MENLSSPLPGVKSVIMCFLFLLAGISLPAKNEKPIRVFDRFGNEVMGDPDFSNTHFATNPTVQAGYFQLTFEDCQYANGLGFDDASSGQARRDVAVQVFTDISQLVVPANDPYTNASNLNQPLVKIKIAAWSYISPAPPASALGVGSSYYASVQNATTGQTDGEVFKTINGGINSWAHLAEVGMYPSTSYHGYLAINLNNYPFYTDLSNTTTAGQYDLYSIMLHESMHMLGFNSLIDGAGGSTISFSSFYSRYDNFLHTAAGAALINNSDGCYGVSFNVPASELTPPAGCANAITFNGTQTHPVYSPAVFAPGSSLSHFDNTCPPNINYLMTYASPSGPASMIRKPTPEEVTVLNDLGYQTTSTFGTQFLVANGSLTNTYSYDNTYTAGGERVGGVNDFFAFNTPYNYYQGIGGVPSTYNDFLQNDENVDHFTCLEIVFGGGTLSSITPTAFTYTPDVNYAAQSAILRYIPVSASGKKGNFTFMFINVVAPALPVCPSTDCNLVCNGDIESVTQKYASPLGNFEITPGSNSPDLYHNNYRVSDNATSGYMGCSSAAFPMPHGGLQYVAIMGGPPPSTINNSEGVNFPLSSPMIAGQTYKISLWARNHSPSCSGYLNLVASPLAPCPMPVQTNLPPGTTYCGYTYTPYAITTFSLNNVMSWTQFTITYTPAVTCNYFMIYGTASGFFSYMYLDDIEIYKTPLDVTAGADTTICSGDAATLNGNVLCTDPALNYSWSNANGPVGSTATVSVSPTVTTTYTLTVTDPTSGTTGSDVVVVTVQNCSTGLPDEQRGEISVFPNPAKGSFTIQLPDELNGKESEIKIVNLPGETIYSFTSTSSLVKVNMENYAEGIYFILLRSGDKNYTGKIVLGD
jgi:hypothetical protein